MHKYFYFDRGVNYLLIGVPLTWLDAQPAGDVVIDPTTSLTVNDDVWLEDTGNKNSHQLIIVGKSRTPSTDYPKKRTVIEFDVSSISSSANVINAQMQLYYYAAVRPTGSTDPWIDRWIQAHQLLVDWDEAQATKVKRLTSTNWNADWGAIDGTDADSTMESTVLFQEGETGTWKSWNLTNVTQDWVDGSATNYGVILWATNEDTDGYEMRFRSSEYSSDQPKLEVTYTTDPLKTVFFLKDHLGSIRATVEEDGDVVGYTDYDPWGYLLANRVLETGWSGQNVAQNKFTGKEWDDDYDLNWFHFGARPYDPEIGRWLGVDPLAEKYPSLSPYNYVANNPLRLVDLKGEDITDLAGNSITQEQAKKLLFGVLREVFKGKEPSLSFKSKINSLKDQKRFLSNPLKLIRETLFGSGHFDPRNVLLGENIDIRTRLGKSKVNTISVNTTFQGDPIELTDVGKFGLYGDAVLEGTNDPILIAKFITQGIDKEGKPHPGSVITLLGTIDQINAILKDAGINTHILVDLGNGRFEFQRIENDKKEEDN